jgi:hypothetical protein
MSDWPDINDYEKETISDIKAETRPIQASAGQAAVYDFCTAVLKGEDVNDVLYSPRPDSEYG